MKIYILAPYVGSGGPESLHILCEICTNLGLDASLCYYFDNPNNIDTLYPDFSNYKIKIIKRDQIEQSPNNWIILPEYGPFTKTLDLFKNMKRIYWWLSVDNNHGLFTNWSDHTILHAYQSIYGLVHILNNNGKAYLPLYDYINDEFLKPINLEKEDIICYNPTKDKLTPSIKHLFNYETIPLVNLSRTQMIDILKRSKVYIDFGYHPGKEKIPREAGMLKNILITGKKGSAYFFEDLPIPYNYKFKDTDTENIIKAVNLSVKEYNTKINDFDLFRNITKNQKIMVYEQVKRIFKNE